MTARTIPNPLIVFIGVEAVADPTKVRYLPVGMAFVAHGEVVGLDIKLHYPLAAVREFYLRPEGWEGE